MFAGAILRSCVVARVAYAVDKICNMKNAIDDYKHSIQLFFDDESENLISSYINELRSNGLLNENLIKERYKPHISLAVYRALEAEYAERVLQTLATRFTQFELRFSHFGIFSAELKVLYLGPTFSPALRDIHCSLHTQYRERPERCWEYYLPDNWIPHCGLMVDKESDNITQGLRLLMSKTLPQVTVTSVAATGFPQRISCILETKT